MWVRKTEEEINNPEKETLPKRKKRLRLAFRDAIITFLFVSFFSILRLLNAGNEGPNELHPYGIPLRWKEIGKLSIYLWLFPLLIALGVFAFRLFTGKFVIQEKDPDEIVFYICDKCNSRTDNYLETCDCGGRFVNVNRMKWVDDEKENT